MKLQFAFGNPRKGSKKVRKSKKGKKKVAKSHKKPKTKRVAKTIKKSKGFAVAKARKKVVKKARKNPMHFVARKKGKIIGRGRNIPTPGELGKESKEYFKALRQYESYKGTDKKKAKLRKALVKAKKKHSSTADLIAQEKKTAKRYVEDGADVKFYSTEGKPMAKRKKSRKKSHKKVAKKSHKKVSKKKHSKKRHSKRRVKKHVAKKVHAKKVHTKKRRKHRSKRRAKMVTHSHSASTRHLKKGTRLRVKASGKSGKKRVSLAGILKVNPFKGNPMKNISKLTKTYAGMEMAELGSIALGGALVPVINSALVKVPGVSTVVAKINEYVGPQAAGSALPILAGLALNAAGEHLIKGDSKKYAHMLGEGLVAAGVIGLSMSLSQKYLAPALGLAGVNYTPMSGINYSPMNGVNYTPMGIVPQMGVVPQLAGPDFGHVDYGRGGYQEDHRFSSSDFGGMSMDASGDDMLTEDDILDDSMGGLG